MNQRQAVILAGGRGTRLRPYTTVFPKPLVPVGERPILEIIVRQLAAKGVVRLVFAVNHLAELIRAYFGGGERWHVEIRYSVEEKALGTAGPISMINELDEEFMVLNGDILTDMDFADLWEFHQRGGAIATIATCLRPVPISLGVLDLDDRGGLLRYTEKPILHYRVSMGMYVFQRRIRDFLVPNEYLDLPDLMKRLMAAGERIHCYDFKGRWLDIGNPEDYAMANELYGSDEEVRISDNRE
jgi:NDP-sugar pyrophosphorylase family protein